MFYETVDDITADAGIKVRAETLEDLFCKAILATFNEITDIENIEGNEEHIIEAKSSMPFLLADIINEALLIHEKYNFVANKCKIISLGEDYVKVKLKGGKFDSSKNEPKLVIKAATYHRLRIEKKEDYYEAEVIFDI